MNELAGALAEVQTQLDKAKAEIVAKVAALEAALNDVTLPADAEAALASLKASAQALDDLNPDVV